MSFIKRLFGVVETDLSKIMGVFHKTKADLQAYIEHHNLQARTHADLMVVHQEAADAASSLAADGEAMLEKIKAFTG